MWPPDVKRAYITSGVPDQVIKSISRTPSAFHRCTLEYFEGYRPSIHGFFTHQRNYGPKDTKFWDVKLKELPDWLMRRRYDPRFVLAAYSRAKSQYVNGFEGSVMTKIPKNFNFVTKTAPVRRIYLLMFFGVALYTADKANLFVEQDVKYVW